MRRELVRWVVVALVVGVASSAMAGSAEVLLEKGVFLQETKGDLDGAVAVYRQIVADAKADRPHAAEAQYRLGVCLQKLKRSQEAVAAFEALIAYFPQAKTFVAKARREIIRSRKSITGVALAKIVEQAVLTISTCAETDPRVRPALESLDGLDEPATVKALGKFLDSETATVRRSAIFILYKAGFTSIETAVPALLRLCEHKEDLTRGMAGIALGTKKVESSFKVLCEMTLSDKSEYSRRCAAYALGLMGNVEARPVLEKALKDENTFVRNNARAALTMLKMAEAGEDELPPAVMAHIIGAHLAAYYKARPTPTNTHIYGVDETFAMTHGGLITFRNDTDKPIAGEVGVGNLSYPDLIIYDETGRTKNFRLRQPGFGAGGTYRLFWTPSRPIKPDEVTVLGWRRKRTTVLPKVAGGRELVMKNRYGAEVVESFFLVLPAGMEIAGESLKRTSRTRIGQYDVCLYQRKVPAGTTNTVKVVLQAKAAKAAPTVKKTSPVNYADNVPASTKTLSVTFDQTMRDGNWSWVRRYADKYPKTTGKPSFDAARTTCSVPVALEPGKVYWIEFNSPPYASFKSEAGAIARRHVLVFATATADGKPTPIPAGLLRRAKGIIGSSAGATGTGI